jgi:hypothetical protein
MVERTMRVLRILQKPIEDQGSSHLRRMVANRRRSCHFTRKRHTKSDRSKKEYF